MNDWTRVPRRIKKKWQARETAFLVTAWVIGMAAFLYLLGFLAEQFDGRVDWP